MPAQSYSVLGCSHNMVVHPLSAFEAHKSKLLCSIFIITNKAVHRLLVVQQVAWEIGDSPLPPDYREKAYLCSPGQTGQYKCQYWPSMYWQYTCSSSLNVQGMSFQVACSPYFLLVRGGKLEDTRLRLAYHLQSLQVLQE